MSITPKISFGTHAAKKNRKPCPEKSSNGAIKTAEEHIKKLKQRLSQKTLDRVIIGNDPDTGKDIKPGKHYRVRDRSTGEYLSGGVARPLTGFRPITTPHATKVVFGGNGSDHERSNEFYTDIQLYPRGLEFIEIKTPGKRKAIPPANVFLIK